MSLAAPIPWPDAGVLRVLGWTGLHSLWLAAVVAAGLALAFRLVPPVRARIRSRLAVGALALLAVGTTGIGTSLMSDWSVHSECWQNVSRPGPTAAPVPARCRPHVGSAAAARADATSPPKPPSKVERALAVGARTAGLATLGRRSLDLFVGASRPMAWVGAAWALVGMILLARLVAGLLAAARLSGTGEPVTDPRLLALFRDAVERVEPGRTVELRAVPELDSPALVGWLRPTVLIPRRMAVELSDEELGPVLAHELAHVTRSDYAVNAAQGALDAALFFNPFHRWISRQARHEREAACDRAVVGRGSVPVRGYVEGLLAAEARRRPDRPKGLAPLYHGGGGLLDRASRLTASRLPGAALGRRRTVSGWTASVLAAGLLAASIFTTVAVYEAASLSSFGVMAVDLERREAPPSSTVGPPVERP